MKTSKINENREPIKVKMLKFIKNFKFLMPTQFITQTQW